ncbi:hypothetical protein [Nocardioides sp. AE5]|uniref:hypothetical protein n=1 Tax=Nocardioides sp. AE5 TaxID=2962573 RepID=UPI002880D938|nr:hypothetical protein [Nocardioides sp. AE5]MDT0201345.1 hypothetical protein [Nocardioides sp. AE5]
MITTVPIFWCRTNEELRDVIGKLYGVTPGSKVILNVGKLAPVDLSSVRLLQEYVPSLHLELQGEVYALQLWEKSLRGEDPWGAL